MIDRFYWAVLDSIQGTTSPNSIQLNTSQSLAFPASEFVSTPSSITTSFLSLFGTDAFDPELTASDLPPEERTLYESIQHRLLWLLFESWFCHRSLAQYAPNQLDSISQMAMSFIGYISESTESSTSAQDHFKLAPLLFSARGTIDGLQKALRLLFREYAPAVTTGFERSIAIPVENKTKLGVVANELGYEMRLGITARESNHLIVSMRNIGELSQWDEHGIYGKKLYRVVKEFAPEHAIITIALHMAASTQGSFQLGEPHCSLGFAPLGNSVDNLPWESQLCAI